MSDTLWITRLRKAGIHEDIIQAIYHSPYDTDDFNKMTDLILADDGRAGLGSISAPSNDPVVRRHDIYMLLHAHGYPLESPVRTQAVFFGQGILTGKWPLWALGGAIGGGAIMLWRELF